MLKRNRIGIGINCILMVGVIPGCLGSMKQHDLNRLVSGQGIQKPAAIGFQPARPDKDSPLPVKTETDQVVADNSKAAVADPASSADPAPLKLKQTQASSGVKGDIPVVAVPPIPLGGDRNSGLKVTQAGATKQSATPSISTGVTPEAPAPLKTEKLIQNSNQPASNTPNSPVQPTTPASARKSEGGSGVIPVSASQVQPGSAVSGNDNSPLMQSSEPVTVASLQHQAQKNFATIDSYMSRLTRRELGKGKKDDETLLFQARKTPFSVHFKWLAGDGKGREVLYVKDRYDNKLHTLLAPGDIPLSPGGRVISLPLDSIMVRAQSKYPITYAGIGPMIERFSAVWEANLRGDFRKGKMSYLGLKNRPDYDVPLHMVEMILPPGADLDLPNGGKRLIGYHSRLGLPVLTVLYNERDQEVDYYRFDRILLNVQLDDSDFDPANLGKQNNRSMPDSGQNR